jgi:deoxyribose-phosphate aldolase
MYTFNAYNEDSESINQRLKEILQFTATFDHQKVLREMLSFIDLTTLSGDDTDERVINLCQQAISTRSDQKNIPSVAAVCVYPVFAELVSQQLLGTGIKTACVAGSFPSGQSPLGLRVEEVAYAVQFGADEIDMVISRGKLIEGNEDFILQEVEAIKTACGEAHLKVILETGELKTLGLVRKASELAIQGGADFIKTSTGKIQPAATPEAFMVMLDTIKEYHEATGIKIGIKPAGGISTSEEALIFYTLVLKILGEEWLNSHLFRIGASRLTTDILNEIN